MKFTYGQKAAFWGALSILFMVLAVYTNMLWNLGNAVTSVLFGINLRRSLG